MDTAAPTITMQVAIDCADPHALVHFWADAFGFEVEDHHDIVEQVVAAGFATEADYFEIDGRKAFATAAACRHPSGALPRLLFQQVPEPKTIKDRIHLDIHVAKDDLAALTERVLALGATKLWDGREGPNTWVTYADPEGNEFCLAGAH
jgi:predicted enzyme related to lactoylglutathione lyase